MPNPRHWETMQNKMVAIVDVDFILAWITLMRRFCPRRSLSLYERMSGWCSCLLVLDDTENPHGMRDESVR